MNKIFVVALLFSFSQAWLAAQQPSSKTQAIKLPQDRASYLITPASSINSDPSHPGGKAASETPRILVSVQVKRFGTTQSNTYTWSDHTKTQEWMLDTTFLIEEPSGRGFFIYQMEEEFFPWTLVKRLCQKSFFSWASPATFQEAGKFENKPAHIFFDAKTGNKAWADPETLLPIACEINSTLFRFEFLPPPGAELSLPPAVIKIIKAAEEQIAAAKPITSRAHPRP